MTMTGNWTTKKGRNAHWPIIIVSDGLHGLDPLSDENVVACVSHGHEANASLLARAPKMREALTLALAEIHNPGAGRSRGIDVVEMIEAALNETA